MVQIEATVIPRDLKGKNKIIYSECRLEGENEHIHYGNVNYRLVSPLTRFQRCLLLVITVVWSRPILILSVFILAVVAPVFLFPSGLCEEFRRYQQLGSKSGKNKWFDSDTLHQDNIILSDLPPPKPMPDQCANIINAERFDCFPQGHATEESCNFRGCCWSLPTRSNQSYSDLNIPYCFYPKQYNNYKTINITVTDLGATVFLQNVFQSPYPDDVNIVKMDFIYETENRLHIKIYDAEKQRFETPYPEVPVMVNAAKNTKYFVDIDKEKLGFKVVRKSNNKTIFDSQSVGGFIFADQFLQLSAKVPSVYIYGFGQQRNNFLLDTNWQRITLFNHDCAPADKLNLYGSHPFYLLLENGGLSSGAVFRNSYAMDVILQPAPAITYRAIGGVFDFYFFLGPSPADVISQYTELVGRPFMPPYWSLGFHLCRFGYVTLNKTIEVWNRTRSAQIPFVSKNCSYENNKFIM